MCNFSQQFVSLEMLQIWISPEEQALKIWVRRRGRACCPGWFGMRMLPRGQVESPSFPSASPPLSSLPYWRYSLGEWDRPTPKAESWRWVQYGIIILRSIHVILRHQCWPFPSLHADLDPAFYEVERHLFTCCNSSFLHPRPHQY